VRRSELILIAYWIAVAVIMAVYIYVAGVDFWTNVVLLTLIILGMGFSIAMLILGATNVGSLDEISRKLDELLNMMKTMKEDINAIKKLLEE